LRGYLRPKHQGTADREINHNRRGAATNVQEITSSGPVGVALNHPGARLASSLTNTASHIASADRGSGQIVSDETAQASARMDEPDLVNDLDLLQSVAATLTTIAGRAKMLPANAPTAHSLDQAERALSQIRNVLTRAALAQSGIAPKHYQLTDMDLHEMLVLLLGQRPSMVTLQHGQHLDTTLHLVCFLMPRNGATGRISQTRPSDVFMAVSGAGHGILPLIDGIPIERVRNSLGLPIDGAVAIAALINDLARARTQLH